MTFDALSTIHDTLKSEYIRIHMQLETADLACKDIYSKIDTYKKNHPEETYGMANKEDNALAALYKRWRNLLEIVRQLSIKDLALEKALDEFEKQNW